MYRTMQGAFRYPVAGTVILLLLAGCPGSRAVPPGPALPEGWVELFPDQDWNDIPMGQGEIFTGVVRYVPGGDEPTYVMRYNPYKLESPERGLTDIYCGADSSLDPFVGRLVDIEGSLQAMEIEGQAFLEIWPARIRLAGERAES